ncbi:MerR family transcriptional regulator [Kitasatospora sp. MMS16-BH015]|uniref:MerR family transcriptional regulator n=1 Tax=Kitasatospora sp. MMS16-BH015 TaxID=2018025 RepID=UPI000CA1C96A|nr:MerR family transcriptional regulator [Kitasatospora sp. MMS16-BH015]AUG75624.1 MerR family transcriptional regulator [Kitasatospora sp. MMS16-BH015]
MNERSSWRVGALAEASGLTVRTLHHWDEIGLLKPSGRTSAGHREYDEADLVRLYQVLTLRGLGLGLESISTCLDAGVDPVRLVDEHLAGVERAIAEAGALRDRLAHVQAELAAQRRPGVDALLGVLGAMRATAPVEVLRRHLDEDQLTALREGAAAVGPAAHYLLQVEWPELYRRAEALRTAGAAPDDTRVLRLVRRMDELSALFNGGDRPLSGAVRQAWRADPAALSGHPEAPADQWRTLADFLDAARATLTPKEPRP